MEKFWKKMWRKKPRYSSVYNKHNRHMWQESDSEGQGIILRMDLLYFFDFPLSDPFQLISQPGKLENEFKITGFSYNEKKMFSILGFAVPCGRGIRCTESLPAFCFGELSAGQGRKRRQEERRVNIMIIFYSLGFAMGAWVSLSVKFSSNKLNVKGELLSIPLGQAPSK